MEIKRDAKLEINSGEIKIKHHSEVNYLGCTFDSKRNGYKSFK